MESGQRKSIALTKFQQAGKATIDKIKKQKSDTKPKQPGFDVVQIGSLLFAAWVVLWIVAASVISAVFFVRYMGIIEDNQAWYLHHGSARSAAAETTAVLQSAIEAKEALIASINSGLIKTSYDYAAIESTLAPAMVLKPFLRSFDITFSDRVAGLHIFHKVEEGGRQLVLQSNAADCYLLGAQDWPKSEVYSSLLVCFMLPGLCRSWCTSTKLSSAAPSGRERCMWLRARHVASWRKMSLDLDQRKGHQIGLSLVMGGSLRPGIRRQRS